MNTVTDDTIKDVKVELVSFKELASIEQPLALDNYQRAYVWTDEKIIQLLDDFHEFITDSKASMAPDGDHSQYYMGTLLLHKKTQNENLKHFVIDGQQRLTTLSVLYWLLNNTLPPFVEFSFRSSRSLVNIQQAKQTMNKWFDEQEINNHSFITLFEQLRFTVITVTREDLAFTFFDTQNNRGVPLGSTDLLKAFHLRAIQSDEQHLVEQLQSHCARRWEQVQLQGELGKSSPNNDFAPELFHYYLWRGRNWTGTQVKELESKDEMLGHFGEQSKQVSTGQVALYPAGSNQWGHTLNLTSYNDYRLTPTPQQFGQQAAYLPFALRQPISRGVGFFLYAEKYSAMLNMLLHSPCTDPEIHATQKFYHQVVTTLSAYLQSLYRLALLTYFDRLGSHGLLRFALWLDHRIGAIRLSQDDIRRETPLKFLRESSQNLLDVIAYAYEGEDVVRFLQKVDVEKAYSAENGWKEAIESNWRVKERYAHAVSKYYDSMGSLNLKTKKRIEDKVITELMAHSGSKSSNQKGPLHG